MEKVDKVSFLTKIFQTKKSGRRHTCKWTLSDQNKGWSPPNFNRDNVRLVVISQNHTGPQEGRVLFDSKSESRAACKAQDTPNRSMCKGARFFRRDNRPPPCTPSRSQSVQDGTPTCRESRPRLSSDIKVLEEMMFGSAPIIPKGSSLKVHTTKSPPQLMVTKLFLPTDTNKNSSEHEGFDLYSVQSISMESIPMSYHNSLEKSQSLNLAQSVPVDVPMQAKVYGASEETEDSGFSASVASSSYSSSFTTSGYSPSSSASLNSLNSRTRRLQRNKATSLDYSINKRLSDDGAEPMPTRKSLSRLGIGITFTLPEEDPEVFRQFESFFFSHITLIESHVVKLKVAVEKGLQMHNKHMVVEALAVFRNAVYDLYTAPRLTEPVWLNMMQYSKHQVALSQGFLKDFVWFIDKFDTKTHKFFMSTLITAVLTHHLAWVPTVTPAGATPARTYLDKHSAKWLNALARSHPYNPLWAQLGDLYGAIGFPLRLSRTVVVGQKADTVCKLLQVLSYFIRCSAVQENTENRDNLDYIDGHMDIPGSAMRTIEEDDLSEVEDTVSCGKIYGSATSLGTIRHIQLQTSVETVMSGKSDRTFVDQGHDIKKEVSFSDSVSWGRTRSDSDISSDVAQCCSVSGKEVDLEGCKCSEQTEVSSDLFCSQCRLLRTSQESLFMDSIELGTSVFYCCQDCVEESGQRSYKCNFDLVRNELEKREGKEEIGDSHETTQTVDSGCCLDDETPEDCSESMRTKALKLFRMLSVEPVDDICISGELDTCESSFCDNLLSETDVSKSSTATQDDSEKSKPADQTKPFRSASLIKTEPAELFPPLHDTSVKSSPSVEELSSQTNKVPKLLRVKLEKDTTDETASKCSVLPSCDIENRVQVRRVRHVGRVSRELQSGELDAEHIRPVISPGPTKQLPVQVDLKNQDSDQDLKPAQSTQNEDLAPQPSKLSKPSPSYEREASGPTHEPAKVSPVPSSSASELPLLEPQPALSSPQPAPRKSTSPEPALIIPKSCGSQSDIPLYPSLQTSVQIPTTVALTAPQPGVACQGTKEPNSMESALLRNPSLHEEPGSVKLVKQDPGTLYPKIDLSGNTIMSSLTSTSQSRPNSIAPNWSVSSYGPSLEVIRDVEDDDVFIGERGQPQGLPPVEEDTEKNSCQDLSPVKEEENVSSRSVSPVAEAEVVPSSQDILSVQEMEGALSRRSSSGSISSSKLTSSKQMRSSPVSLRESQECISAIETDTTDGLPGKAKEDTKEENETDTSPSHAKVTAWLGSQEENEIVHLVQEKSNTPPLVELTPVTEVKKSTSESRLTEEPITVYTEDSKRPTCPTLSMAKVSVFGRSNSIFDEYVFDDTIQLPDPSEVEENASSAADACDLSENYVVHDTNISLDLSENIPCENSEQKNLLSAAETLPDSDKDEGFVTLVGPLSMQDKYFTDETDPVTLPDCTSKDMFTSALSLMQETPLADDNYNIDDLLDLRVESRSRSNSGSSLSRVRSHGLDRQQSSGSHISRQNSLGSATAPARCRPVTPTELGRRRHTSSTSNISWDLDSPEARNNMKEVEMPRTVSERLDGSETFEHNFGHSLMAGYTDHYMSDFVLHGTNDNSFTSKLHTDLTIAVQNSILDEPITEACCIVADIDKSSVRLSSCQQGAADRVKPSMELTASQIVSDILESVQKLWKLKMSPEFCLMHLEDRLQEIYFKSKVLSEYILIHRKIDQNDLTTMLGLDVSDLPLLLAVAGTHTPTLGMAFASERSTEESIKRK